MARSIERLTTLDIRQADAGALLCDGGGLYFRASGLGRGSWEFRYSLHGKERWMGLGPYPRDVSLAAARKKVVECRKLLHDGIDPIEARRIERIKKRLEAKKNKTFWACVEEYIALHFTADGYKDAEKAAKRMRRGLELYSRNLIGEVPVKLIDTDLVIETLTPIWETKPETADKIRGWIETVLGYAKVRGYREGDNPAIFRDHLQRIMPKRSWKKRTEHHAGLHYDDIGEFMLSYAVSRVLPLVPSNSPF